MNRGFRYGDGLFETMRLISGKLPLVLGHYERMRKGAMILGMNAGHLPSVETLEAMTRSLASQEGCEGCLASARVRWTVFRVESGVGAGYTPKTDDIGWTFEVAPLSEQKWEQNPQGLHIGDYLAAAKPINPWSDLKTANAMLYVQAGISARQRNLHDAVIYNEQGELCETTSSNLFLVKDSLLWTPPLDSGCLPGIMRDVIIEIARGSGLDVQDKPLHRFDLLAADEVFLTNAVHGTRWVIAFEHRRYLRKLSVWLTEALNEVLLPETSEGEGQA